MSDYKVSEPDYYAKNGLSPIQAFEQGLMSKEEYVGFCKGNVIKYTIRAGEKTDDPLMDIVKAMDYLHYLHKALKSEPKSRDDEYTVADLEDKLNEVKESISEYKQANGLNDAQVNEKKREFPKLDKELRHVEPLVHKHTSTSRSLFRKIKNNPLVGAWY